MMAEAAFVMFTDGFIGSAIGLFDIDDNVVTLTPEPDSFDRNERSVRHLLNSRKGRWGRGALCGEHLGSEEGGGLRLLAWLFA